MKKYLENENLRAVLVSGASKLENYVAGTLGPAGNTVLIHNTNFRPIATKDGVTVAKSMILENPFENLAAQVLTQAAEKTEKTSGDGTTTTICLANAILAQAQRYVVAGANSFELKRGIELAVEEVVKLLSSFSTQIDSKERVAQIATLAANGDYIIGNLIADAIDQIGKDGSIVVENGTALQTTLKIVEGFRLPAGYISQAFIVEEGRAFIKYQKPYFLVTDAKIEFVDELLPILKFVARENRPLIIVADYVEGQALAALITNATRGTMKIVAINAPFYGEEKKKSLKDLALITGATLVGVESGIKLEDATLQHLGSSVSVEIQKNFTTIIDGVGNNQEIEKRISLLQDEIQQTQDMEECGKIQERISRLVGGIAIIKIGAATEIEVQEKRFRIDDALEAIKSAQEEGIVPGGGSVFQRIAKKLEVPGNLTEDQSFGFKIVQRALKTPFEKLLTNAGLVSEIYEKELLKEEDKNIVFDLREKQFKNAYLSGILDPTKVLRCSLQNATSAALALLTTSYAIVEG